MYRKIFKYIIVFALNSPCMSPVNQRPEHAMRANAINTMDSFVTMITKLPSNNNCGTIGTIFSAGGVLNVEHRTTSITKIYSVDLGALILPRRNGVERELLIEILNADGGRTACQMISQTTASMPNCSFKNLLTSLSRVICFGNRDTLEKFANSLIQ